jgi:hypothetical protein
MKISSSRRYAVLTGDIVGSSKLSKPDRQRLPQLLKRAARETQKAFPGTAPLELDVFRGDSWQWLLQDDVRCLRIALYLRACLRSEAERGRGLDTRIAIAIGPVDFVPKNAVSEGDGEAYRASGRALEQLPGNRLLTLTATDQTLPSGVDVSLQLLDAVVQGWTGKQAEAVTGALRGWTQEKIAQTWSRAISQPAVTKHLAKAFWPNVEAGLIYVEGVLGKGDAG